MGFRAEAGGKELVKKVCLFTGSVSSKGLMRENAGYSLAVWVQFVDHWPEIFGGVHFARELREVVLCCRTKSGGDLVLNFVIL